MFKIIKIRNSGANVPELIKLPKNTSKKINYGTLIKLEDGMATVCNGVTSPSYVAMENASAESADIVCCEVVRDMIFETKINAAPDETIKIGSKLTLAPDSDSCAAYVSTTTSGGVATVINLLNAKEAYDKVLVKFEK